MLHPWLDISHLESFTNHQSAACTLKLLRQNIWGTGLRHECVLNLPEEFCRQLSLHTADVKFLAKCLVPRKDPINMSYFCHSALPIYWNPY